MLVCFSAEPSELPLYADACAETTLRFRFFAERLELPHETDAYAKMTMRLCSSAQPPATAPQHRYLWRRCVSVFLLNPWNCPITQIPVQKHVTRFCFSAKTSDPAHNAVPDAETTMRFCSSAKLPETSPQRR
jgi:hypothetical protein